MKSSEFEPKTREIRHLRKFKFSIPYFISMCTEGSEHHFRVKEYGFPEGAKPVHVYVDHMTMVVYVVLEHESFSPVKEGQPIPTGDYVTFERIEACYIERCSEKVD